MMMLETKYAWKHKLVSKEKGKPNFCEQCKITDKSLRYEWASKTGTYDDANDYIRLCKSCHVLFDRKQKIKNTILERQLQYVKEWRRSNYQKYRSMEKKLRKKNIVRAKAAQKKYRISNHTKIIESNHKRYQMNHTNELLSRTKYRKKISNIYFAMSLWFDKSYLMFSNEELQQRLLLYRKELKRKNESKKRQSIRNNPEKLKKYRTYQKFWMRQKREKIRNINSAMKLIFGGEQA